jgi:hypothetical protein
MTLNRVPGGRASAGRPACGCGCAERLPCYPTDLTDEQWAVLEPFLPVMLCDTGLGGRPEKHRRRTMNPPGESGDSICWESVRHGTSSEELPA